MRILKKTIRQLLEESISLDIEKGDVILTGRFKNKRRIVKSIGTDKWGQPTINGKSILKFKIEKKMPKKKWSAKSREELSENSEQKMKLLRETVRKLILENEQKEMVDKLNTMLGAYIEQDSNYNYSEDSQPDHSIYVQAMELATSLGLERHPELKVWGAVNWDYDGEVIKSNLTQEEALNVKMHAGDKVYTKGELIDPESTYYKYYDAFPGWESMVKFKR